MIIVSGALAAFFYVQSVTPLGPVQTRLTDLKILPAEPQSGQNFTISVNVTNTVNTAGYCALALMIDNSPEQNQTIQLSGSESKIVEFNVIAGGIGNHTAQINNLSGDFVVTRALQPAIFQLSNFSINQTEVGINQPVKITVAVSNVGEQTNNYSATLLVNDTLKETQTITLAAGGKTSIEFVVAESTPGTYILKVGNLTGTLSVFETPPVTELQLANLIINPQTASIGGPVRITVDVTNTGKSGGNYSLSLTINDAKVATRNVELSSGATTTLEFTVNETTEGSYTVKIGTLLGTFSVQAVVGKPANIVLSDIFINPLEAWPGDFVNMTAAATNFGEQTGQMKISLTINGQVKGSQTVKLAGGAATRVSFNMTAGPVGTYSVSLGTLSEDMTVVAAGYHTLAVKAQASITFNIDGQDQTVPYSALLKVGPHTLIARQTDPTGKFNFTNWDDGTTSLTRVVDVERSMFVYIYYSGGTSSCPSLYVWNGTDYAYATEVSDHGWLGYINYINQDGSVVFWRNNPWDYIKMDQNQMQLSNGYYNLTLVQRSDEIFYIDSAYMVAVDHPANVDVYSTSVEQYLDPNYMGQIYTVSKNMLTPISAVNQNGENVLPQIAKVDGAFTSGINGIDSPSWNNTQWNTLTLNLGNLTNAKQIKLVVRATVDWGDPTVYGNWLNSFFAQPVPNGTQPTPQSYMEVKDASGNWVRVPDSRQFPLPPHADVPDTFVVDLTGLFPTNDYELRINNFWNVTFDYVGVDTSPQGNISIHRIDPQASLFQQFGTTSTASGNFTRYGDVTPLLLNADDEFVIGRQGDAVSLSFPIANLSPLAPGMVRDYFLFEASWFKDMNGNWGYGFGFTVDPLPFHNMSGFPYPLNTESYPNDAAHLSYLQDYNTRILSPPSP